MKPRTEKYIIEKLIEVNKDNKKSKAFSDSYNTNKVNKNSRRNDPKKKAFLLF